LFLWELPECITHDRNGLCLAKARFVFGLRIERASLSPPFRSTLPRNPEEIGTKSPALWPKPVRPSPYLNEHFLQNVFGRLTIAEMLHQVRPQRRRVLLVKDAESIRVSLADLFPKLSVVSQSASPSCYSGLPVKKIIQQQKNAAATAMLIAARAL
jgi:hypothetical protein